jgi:hypothetical protein
MAWPAAYEYQAAVQSADNFSEPALRTARPALNALGLPIAACGNFAAVFRMENAGGRFALRCFLRDVPGRAERYALLRSWLENREVPWLLPFRYVAEGIRLGGRWFPVVLMTWVEGETLDAWVNRNLGQPGKLKETADRWKQLADGLHASGIAHGDLQASNIMVDSAGNLKLVDYDALFVPSLAAAGPGEIGHAAYQHPGRRPDQQDADEGDFASLVIYVSLLALEDDPTLWQEYNDGGENLIFSARDLLHPRQSALMARLRNSPNPQLSHMTSRLDAACREARPGPAPLARLIAENADAPGGAHPFSPGKPGTLAARRRACPVPVSPAPGETLEPGTTTLIAWRPVPAEGALRVELLREGKLERILAAEAPAGAGGLSWLVPLSAGSHFQVRLGRVDEPGSRAVTNGEFRILPRSLARRLDIFEKKRCSHCQRFYTDPPACPYDTLRARCTYYSALGVPERDAHVLEDRWWARIATLTEADGGEKKE